MEILLKNRNIVIWDKNHKNIDKIIDRNDSKCEKDSKFHFRNGFIVILWEIYWPRGRPIAMFY